MQFLILQEPTVDVVIVQRAKERLSFIKPVSRDEPVTLASQSPTSNWAQQQDGLHMVQVLPFLSQQSRGFSSIAPVSSLCSHDVAGHQMCLAH